jgi:signal transduction histidine kinase
MQTLPKNPDILPLLQSFSTFADIPTDALQWMIEQSQYLQYDRGEQIFRPGDPVNEMGIILKGQVSLRVEVQGGLQEIAILEKGDITGLLPFSRMKEVRALGIVTEPLRILYLHKDQFTEMVNRSYELTQALVARMSDRVRDFTNRSVQQEKLAALGRLSAGLAHELNNPSSAMVRNAEELYQKIHATPEKFKSIMTMGITPEQTDRVNAILFAKIESAASLELSLLERENLVDDLTDWLEDQGMDNIEDIADTFADFGMSVDELEQIESIVGNRALPSIMWWLESTLSLERLVDEIQEASSRISKLVSSIKEYSHMDRGNAMERVHLPKGIKSTLTMLKHKLKQKRIAVTKAWPEDLPDIHGSPGELNQIWTNLIANAIDALPDESGQLSIRAEQVREFVQVEIEDNGSGIPEEIQNQIFEPFFTTKPMDQGTGMGLDIVKKIIQRHNGSIEVVSKPGQTIFRLRFPALQ